MNISSVVVRVLPDALEAVKESLLSHNFCEVHFNDSGRIIVTIEASDLMEESRLLGMIEGMESVLSAEIMYTYNEGEIDAAMKEIGDMDKVLGRLNDSGVSASDMSYSGDLKNYGL